MTEKCTNSECKKEFNVSYVGGGVPGGKDTEPVACPYCFTIIRTERTSAAILISKIDDEFIKNQ